MGTDRAVGLGILAFLGIMGLTALVAFLFSGKVAAITFGVIVVGFFLYIGLIAAIYDTDPMKWTGEKITEFFDGRKNNG